jgi:cysteinyl-tRNA synthetase
MLKLYNTESREKEPFSPNDGQHVKMYTCGPTVYHFAHIGNFRAFLFEDVLRRTLKYLGFKVTQVMNLTDVDDKTIKGAIRDNVTLDEFTKPYKEAFFEDLKTLNVDPAEYYPQATDFIPKMIEMIQGLIDKGVAYVGADSSVYFAIRKFPRYGCLSHLHLDELRSGASNRVQNDEYDKESVSDFVLWKAYDPERDGQIYWDSPYGKGRPGWHLECSAMAMDILGSSIDIHCGGVDNMFPHHENEIAQSECYSGERFVKLWMHSEHLIVDNKKMSKSLGNFYTLRDLLAKGYSGREIRYMLIHTHYKTQLNFTFQGLEAIRSSLDRIKTFVTRLREVSGPETESVASFIVETQSRFKAALQDDLNVSLALAALFDFIRDIHSLIDQNRLGKLDALNVINFLKRIDSVLGFIPLENDEEIPEELNQLLEKRMEARKTKNWALSDQIRDQIHASGYVIEDTPTGARLKKA